YNPLRSDDSIRLLHILPATEASERLSVLCKEHIRDAEETYITISYTWDNQPFTREILVNGGRLLATHNAYEALKALRQVDRTHCVWIDAICINQTDDAEKIKQVRRMRDVYANAQHTMIWLGDPTPGITAAMRFIHSL
ncbi:HET-domain-containing protein, partial [Bimuria novae-zelandiae CBS 107.79]